MASIHTLESDRPDNCLDNPEPLDYIVNDDAHSELSDIGSQLSKSQSLKLVKTETKKSLFDMGVSSQIPIPDTVYPQTITNPLFPEEYTLETATGFVPVSSLQGLGRSVTRTTTRGRRNSNFSNISGDSGVGEGEKQDGSEDATPNEYDELDPGIELVTFMKNDPENPHNWPNWVKWCYTLLFSCAVIMVAYGSSCVTGGLGLISEKYGVSEEVAILSCSLMVLGFAVGPLLWSPLSEQIGRRPVYFISFGLYTIFNIPCAIGKNIGTLLVCRFLCGVFSSSGLCLVGGSISDMFDRETRGFAIAFFAFAPYSGPVFGPLCNGFVNISTGRFDLIIWINMAFAGVMWIVCSCIPETYAPSILKRRAAKLRKEIGNDKIMTEQEALGLSLKELVQTCLIRPLYFSISEPVLVLVCGYVCLIYSLLYAFFFAYPVVFGDLYGFKDNKIGLMFIPILIGALFALVTTPVLERRYMALCKRRAPTPEDRLIGAMVGSPFPAIALFILGATSYKHVFWVGPASSGIAFGYGMVLIYYSLNNYIIDTYAKYAASALATKVFLRSAGGAAFPLFTTQMYHKLGLQWASWLLAFISLVMVLIPFVFYRYGAVLREKMCKEDYTGSA
ncbi:hypothetical protein BABINDRAFT_7899 [Babjeviella inositovora NRRL Y-12698]|uniref:Major facilitator superfamily (MFS) profile domain-containing protein n=1 Tax=Babjeviella inositovora NRRL Y-12698 TaxID=984486 RepID=A0A1E3QRK5_9ASCO|nr:uncharacterized protein BABINDRAFT_7899 [Babjeviella inositovora NRRL Y-12698]ODQ79682.1 hypothetical protein BABINDRAFT_7899 [Babjeviella inositovora NRRL Y-12698]